jgi:hypothetical protein
MKKFSWFILAIPFFGHTQTVGFGTWGSCNMNNISEYNPVVDPGGASNAKFGNSVSLSGNFAIIGSYGEKVGANSNQGSASIYQHNNTNWVFMQKLTDATGAAHDYFGYSVSVSGNYAIAGACNDDLPGKTDAGSVSIYQYDGSSWVLMQKLTDATGASGDYFGYSVSISGNFVIAGAPHDDMGANANQGSASIYQYDGSSWVFMQKVTNSVGAANDFFGNSVSISGTYAVVGAYMDDEKDFMGITRTDMGSASIYRNSGANWVLMKKITFPQGLNNDYFATSVSISGNYVIAGEPGRLTGKGAVDFFRYDGTNWVYMQKIFNIAGTDYDYFGNSVFISGDYAIVGAYSAPVNSISDAGAATIYRRIGLGWIKMQFIPDPGENIYDEFGKSVIIDETTKRFLIGNPGHGSSSGIAFFGKLNE